MGCGRQGRYFCWECLKAVRLRGDWVCPRCNRAAVGGRVHLGCWQKYGLDGLVSLLSYKGMVRLGVQELKYELVRDIEREFLRILVMGVKEKLKDRQGKEWKRFLRKRPVVVGVPLHWRRENWRGFNQAEVVGRWVGEALDLERERWLERRRATRPQVGLKGVKRGENVRWAFRVREGKLPKRVLLVDDVWTTGATMRAGSQALKRGGVEEVWGLSLAR